MSNTTKTTMSRGFLSALIIPASVNNWRGNDSKAILKKIVSRSRKLKKVDWLKFSKRLLNWIDSPLSATTPPPLSMFRPGNGKLPFLNWSNLPGVNCPGAGACIKVTILSQFAGWCYSLKAWRYAAAFLRQFQNSILESGPVYRLLIVNELKRLLNMKKYSGAAVPFRLYVDGDFKNLDMLRFWMDTLKKFPRLKAYGYSKSLHLFKELDESGYTWPENYSLNISSGGKYEDGSIGYYVSQMNITRGKFTAVSVQKSIVTAWKKQTLTKAQRIEIKSGFQDQKTFICPRLCGSCTLIKKNPHACGNRDNFNNVNILIPIH